MFIALIVMRLSHGIALSARIAIRSYDQAIHGAPRCRDLEALLFS